MSEDYQNQQTGPEQAAESVEAHRVGDDRVLDKDARQWAMFCHLSALAGMTPVLPGIGAIIGPLIMWQIKKDDYPFADEQGREALNFQISIMLYSMVSAVLICVAIGVPLLIAVGVFDIVMIIIAAISANDGKHYRYPMCIRFIK